MIEQIFQKELMVAKQMHQKNVISVAIGTLKILTLNMDHILVMAFLV